jgi:hypothetical protein
MPEFLAAVAAADERSLNDLFDREAGWEFLLCESYHSEWADKLEEVLDRVVQLGGLPQLVALQQTGTGKKLLDLADPAMRKSINQRSGIRDC